MSSIKLCVLKSKKKSYCLHPWVYSLFRKIRLHGSKTGSLPAPDSCFPSEVSQQKLLHNASALRECFMEKGVSLSKLCLKNTPQKVKKVIWGGRIGGRKARKWGSQLVITWVEWCRRATRGGERAKTSAWILYGAPLIAKVSEHCIYSWKQQGLSRSEDERKIMW